jgi:hypothetical protein
MQDKTYINRCEKDMDPDQEIIDANKSKLVDNISHLLVLIFSISIVAWIIQVIRLF